MRPRMGYDRRCRLDAPGVKLSVVPIPTVVPTRGLQPQQVRETCSGNKTHDADSAPLHPLLALTAEWQCGR